MSELRDNKAMFIVDKECKHSRRYACADEDFPIKTIYMKRELADKTDVIAITVEIQPK